MLYVHSSIAEKLNLKTIAISVNTPAQISLCYELLRNL